ncbi:Galectin-3-binding protein B, partial [Trichoplax sp. H2]
MTSKICTLGIFTLVLVEILCSSTYANQDSIEIQESTSSCLENCQCRDSEIRCEGFPSDIHRTPEGVKRIVFQKAISCEEENLQRLHKLIVLTNIELIGQCNCPERLAGHDLKDVNELRSNSLELHRHERSVDRRSIINSRYALSLDKTWNSTSGYVSVQYKGRTGVICESLWYLENADVICRQIGYIGAFSGAYGPGSPRSQATLIHDLSCNGYETVVDQCRISRSSYTCREIYVRGVSCNPGQTAADYDSRNRPDYCTFEKGFCGWSNQATPGFIHHPGDGRHYNPSYSYRNYIYAIRPRNSLIKVNAELISPPFERHSTSSSYVTYVYDVNGSRMNKLLISYRASYGSDTTIESKSFSSSTAGWSSGLSSSFRPNGVFT